jgi:hypothetical protein
MWRTLSKITKSAGRLRPQRPHDAAHVEEIDDADNNGDLSSDEEVSMDGSVMGDRMSETFSEAEENISYHLDIDSPEQLNAGWGDNDDDVFVDAFSEVGSDNDGEMPNQIGRG